MAGKEKKKKKKSRSSRDVVAWGYAHHKGTGIGGGCQLRKVADLREIGLTDACSEFAIEGRPNRVMEWLLRFEDIEVSGPDRDGCDMIVHQFSPKNAGDYFLEAVGANFIKGGGMAARLINRRIRRLKITFIQKGGTHRSGNLTHIDEETTLGEVHHYIKNGTWDDDSDSDSYSYSS